MRYVTYDETGALTGCYLQDVLPEHEAAHIEMPEVDALNWPAYRANTQRDGLELAPPPAPNADQHNAPILAALAAIDAKTIRPLREGDAARVAALDTEAAALRAQLMKGQ